MCSRDLNWTKGPFWIHSENSYRRIDVYNCWRRAQFEIHLFSTHFIWHQQTQHLLHSNSNNKSLVKRRAILFCFVLWMQYHLSLAHVTVIPIGFKFELFSLTSTRLKINFFLSKNGFDRCYCCCHFIIVFLALSTLKRVPEPMNRNLFIWIPVRYNLCESYVVTSEEKEKSAKIGKIRLSAELKINKCRSQCHTEHHEHHSDTWNFLLWFHYFMKIETKEKPRNGCMRLGHSRHNPKMRGNKKGFHE